MKKLILPIILGCIFSLGMLTACSNNAANANEPEVVQMDSIKDSLEVTEEQINNDIDKVQKSLQEVDKEFKN